jgi:hypothetical protein
MSLGSEFKFMHERPDPSLEEADALNSFVTETVPPAARHATYLPVARDTAVIIDSVSMRRAPQRPARRRAPLVLTLLTLLGTAAWGAYVYESGRPLNLDIFSMWAPRPAIQTATAPTAPAPTAAAPGPSEATPSEARPSEARLNERLPDDLPRASDESARSVEADRRDDAVTARPQSTGTSGLSAGPVQNVSGEWRLDTLMETSDSSLQGLKLQYDMKLVQEGDRVTGVGTKISENEKGIDAGAQTPVTMTGTIAGDRLTLNFVEHRSPAETRGKLVLLIDTARTLRGRFSSNATPSSGHVEGHQLSSAQ